MNELQIDQRPNASCISVPLTSEASHPFGHPSITSAKLLCTLAPPPFGTTGTSPVLSRSPSVPTPSVSARLALQKRDSLRARRQQRYSRDESALAVALRRPAEYERIFPPRPSIQYATKQLELRIDEAKARLAELRELLQDDAIDQRTHETSLRARWMLERWITSSEKELPRSTGCPIPPDTVGSSTRNTRRDANMAYFFAHSPTRTTASSMTKHRYSSPIMQPRRISKQNVEPPQLRKWPLASTLRAPMKLKAFPSTSCVTDSDRSVVPPPAHKPSSSPEPQHSYDVDLIPPLSEPSSPLRGISPSAFPDVPDTPLDDSRAHEWHGFAVIYIPSQPSDEELLAVLSAEMEAEPMPEYVSYLLNQLEPIGEGVVLPGLSRKETTTSSGFEFISRPSIEAYDYPVLPRSRLLVRRSMRFPPSARVRLGVLSGLRAVCEYSPPASPSRSAVQEQASPRSGVFSKVRRSMVARGHQ
ncbi:hypothetical protein DFH94DRAFT_707820 [Russula ochroleuca]|uniref:Uncharacterized protein n=1 Tax=Russula ochroleuca TaxID=152965 RepID=A0A9P5N3H8_9AGAM|nr:hypothetical protein DFH94DRAFT_707820 [Russula ochroleuca]